MNKIFKTLEFDLIKNQISQYSRSQMAKDKLLQLQPYHDLEDLTFQQHYIEEATSLVYHYGTLPLGAFDNIEQSLLKADKDGVLFPEEFLVILTMLKNINEIQTYMSNGQVEKGQLKELIDLLYLPSDLYQDIERCIDPTGYILDQASHELMMIRRQIMSLESKIRRTIESLKTRHKEMLSHDVISSRDDHLVLPVKAGHKNHVHGIVHGQSASGRTMFIEPQEVVSLNNQIALAKQEEQQEIHRILLEMSKKVKRYQDVLMEDMENMIDIDFIFAIATYAKNNDLIIPTMTEDFDLLEMKKARHPFIDKDQVVANDIVLQAPQNIFLISGSNTGGKTVVLKTTGLLTLMALCALPISASEATIPLFDHVFVDLGDEQSIEQSLSTFSSHMQRVVDMTKRVTKKSLVLLDEIGSGTDPQEGQSLAQAILQDLHQQGCMTFASTHYSGLKEFAKETDYVKVASVEFDQEKMQPTYRLLEGSVGNSYAIEISKRLGLKQSIINQAYQIKEESMTSSQILLEKLQDEMADVQRQKDELDALLKEANHKEKQYQLLLDKWQEQKQKMIDEAKDQANEILNASKKQVDDVLKSLQGAIKPHQAIEAKRQLDNAQYEKEKPVIEQSHELQVGDIVKVLSVNRQGEIIAKSKKGITIMMGGIKMNLKDNEVEYMHPKVKEKPVRSSLKAVRQTNQQSFELNIIGLRYEEAMIKVDKFIDDALLHNYSMVRIVHGLGTGVLRNGVRKMLDKHHSVTSYRDGGPNEGGLGATLVYFE